MIRRHFLIGLALATALPAFAADERATPEQAQALVKRAIAHYKAQGRQKALADLSNKQGKFIDRDLYVTVYDMEGNCLAHVNEKQIGKNLIELRDPDGKYLIRERIEGVKTKDSGWQDYKYPNPVNMKIEPKRMYFEKHDNLVFAAGAYKPN
jgi:signal transduction histidine kinase